MKEPSRRHVAARGPARGQRWSPEGRPGTARCERMLRILTKETSRRHVAARGPARGQRWSPEGRNGIPLYLYKKIVLSFGKMVDKRSGMLYNLFRISSTYCNYSRKIIWKI